MKFRRLSPALALVLIGSCSPNALAVAKPVTVTQIKPIIFAKLPPSTGDQISGAVLAGKSVVIVGTVEDEPSSWVTVPSLGGSDGVISAIDLTGKALWQTRLGGSGDDIATAILRDSSGTFWVVGASVLSSASPPASPIPSESATSSATTTPTPTPSISITPTPSESSSPTPSSSASFINPDEVQIDPVVTTDQSLRRLMVWKVNKAGRLLNTYSQVLSGTCLPKLVSFDGTNFQITGDIAAASPKSFSISLTAAGVFGQLTLGKAKPTTVATSLSVAAGTATWKSFLSNSPIPGSVKWAPKLPTPVLARYSKSGALLDARYFSGKALFLLWQSTVGLVMLSEHEKQGGFGLTIVTPLAG